jgi:hypothetical protein
MSEDDSHIDSEIKEKHMVWFFAGGETRDDSFNIFTGSFIKLMSQILEDNFDFIRGIYFKTPMMNVIWALNNAQKPILNPENNKITRSAFRQIILSDSSYETQHTITSSSSGSIIAAQTACYLAEENRNGIYFKKPFHLVLGASMISPRSELFRRLVYHQNEGRIGKIIHEEVQDAGDNSSGIGGVTRFEAYSNAFGLMFPLLSKKFNSPSFLNTHPETGHIHRKRSKTVQKAIDYITVILVKHKLAGEHYREVAEITLKNLG